LRCTPKEVSIEGLQKLYIEEIHDLELWNGRRGVHILAEEDIDAHLGDLLLVFDIDIHKQCPDSYQITSETVSNTLRRL